MGIAAHFQDQTTGAGGDDSASREVGAVPREPRRTLFLEAIGETATGDAPVTIHNISSTGLLLETGASLVVGESINVELPHAGQTGATVVWASGALYGCAFAAPLSQAALSAAQLRSGTATAPREAVAAHPVRHDHAHDATLGMRIQRLRKARAMTLSELARRMGVSKPTVWAWEQGKARPVESRFEALCDVLGVPLAELQPSDEDPALQDIVLRARRQIASAYKIAEDRVRILIEL